MANKHDVLVRLDKGMSTSAIAQELGCDTAYVRATRFRENNPEIVAQWARDRLARDPVAREKKNAANRAYKAKKRQAMN